LSRIFYRRRQNRVEDMFDKLIREQNSVIEKLEKDFQDERESFENLSHELEDSKEALAEKTSLLTTLQNRVKNSNSTGSVNLKLKETNNLLSIKNQELEELDRKRVMELKHFEEVLVLAENKIEENEKSHFKVLEKLNEEMEALSKENEKHKTSIKIYEKRIKSLEEALKLYKAESVDFEFIISKDQFLTIEEQLKKYQEEIKALKKENAELLAKLEKSIMGLQA